MPKKRLYRSREDQMLGGVCAGIANYFDIDPTLMRLIFAGLTLVGVGSPILVYLLLWVVMPEEPVDTQQPIYPKVQQPEPMVEQRPTTGTNHVEPKIAEPIA